MTTVLYALLSDLLVILLHLGSVSSHSLYVDARCSITTVTVLQTHGGLAERNRSKKVNSWPQGTVLLDRHFELCAVLTTCILKTLSFDFYYARLSDAEPGVLSATRAEGAFVLVRIV